MTKSRRIKLLKAYRKAGLGISLAYQRIGSYKKKHFGVEEVLK